MREATISPDNWFLSSTDDPPITVVRFDFSRTRSSNFLRPIRFVPNRASLVVGNFTYEELAIRVSLPEEGEKEIPRTTLEMSNVDKRFMPLLNTGRLTGTEVSIRVVQESDSNREVFRVNMDVETITADNDKLVMGIGYTDLLDRAGVRLIYNRRGAPALFQ